MLFLAFASLLLSLLLNQASPGLALIVWAAIAVSMLVRGYYFILRRRFAADVLLTNLIGFASLANAFVGWMDHYGPTAGVSHDSIWNFYMDGFSLVIAFHAVMMAEAWHKIHRREVSLRSAQGLCILTAAAGMGVFLIAQRGHPLVIFFGGTLALVFGEYVRKSAPPPGR